MSAKIQTINVLFNIFPVNGHEELLNDVYKRLHAFIENLMEIKFSYKKDEYLWCIAGGFAAFIQGRTTKYGDIDVYIISNRYTPMMYALKIELGEHKFDIFILSVGQKLTTPLEKYCAILGAFDLDVCRVGLVDGGLRILNVALGDSFADKNDDLEEDRIMKYSQRINKNFRQSRFDWEILNVEKIREKNILMYYCKTINTIFQEICQVISHKFKNE